MVTARSEEREAPAFWRRQTPDELFAQPPRELHDVPTLERRISSAQTSSLHPISSAQLISPSTSSFHGSSRPGASFGGEVGSARIDSARGHVTPARGGATESEASPGSSPGRATAAAGRRTPLSPAAPHAVPLASYAGLGLGGVERAMLPPVDREAGFVRQ